MTSVKADVGIIAVGLRDLQRQLLPRRAAQTW